MASRGADGLGILRSKGVVGKNKKRFTGGRGGNKLKSAPGGGRDCCHRRAKDGGD